MKFLQTLLLLLCLLEIAVVGGAVAAGGVSVSEIPTQNSFSSSICSRKNDAGFCPDTEYTCRMKLPLVGIQSFRLRLRDDATAAFEIQGAISLRDELHYTLDRQTGVIALTAQKKTRRILKTFGLALGAASYDATTDIAWLQVTSRFGLPSVRLQFTRAPPDLS